MRLRKRSLAVAMATFFGGAMLFQTSGGISGCTTFAAQGGLIGFNFCGLLDCTGGFLFSPCGNPTTADDDLLQDCPTPTNAV